MSDNLPAVRGNTAMQFVQNLESNWRLAKAIAGSGMVKHRTPQACIAIMLAANERGIPVMMAMSQIHFFDGNLIMGSNLMWGLAVDRCGLRKEIREWTDEKYAATYYRDGWEPMPIEYTIAEAKRAGLLNKSNWQKFPKDMLAARCDARAVRAMAPDHFAGVYVDAEFVEDTTPSETAEADAKVEALNLELGLEEPGTSED